MPARIWADDCEDGDEYDNVWTALPFPGGQVYIRADIAERMAEAMLASIDMIENCADAPKNPDSLPEMVKVHLQQSLSAWKDDR
jgi:hypothetical protein